jgi:formate hydrogenlyase subunit 3/multisubunit Na+/H+ antiporter MnhD subunit
VTAELSTSTPGGYLLVLAILLPAAGMILSFTLGGRNAERVALCSTPFGFALACAIAFHVARADKPIVYAIGGLSPPLGIALRADGISAVMLIAAAVIVTAAAFYARAKFTTPDGVRESRSALTFWIMLQAIWAALTMIFEGGDLFNLYVALELLTFAAVPLVCIDGRAATLAAALRYLLFALFGSISYLLGVALLYGAHGTLDIPLLAQRIQATPVVWTAAALITGGLLAKTALFPLHLWLPPAHANAPAAASAVLSGLSYAAPVVLYPSRPSRGQGSYGSRLPRIYGYYRWQRSCPTTGAAEIADRLFDCGPDRLSVSGFPARGRSAALELHRLECRLDADSRPCLRQGGDVFLGRPARRSARP